MAAKSSFSRYQSYTTQKKNRERFFSIFITLLLVYLGYLVLTAAFLRTVRWESTTMEPTLGKDTLVLLSPLPFGQSNLPFLPFGLPGWRAPERGELVEVVPRYHNPSPPWVSSVDDLVRFFTLNFTSIESSGRPVWDKELTIRRVIALPGDTVKLENFTAYVKPKGEKYYLSEYELSKRVYSIKETALPENWKDSFPLSGTYKEYEVPEDEYFVLADNRTSSSDSRTWGTVKKSAIKASAVMKYWPLSAWGGL